MFTVPEKTREEIVREEVENIASIGNTIGISLNTSHRSVFDLVWNNANCTPQEVFDALGSDAIKLFRLSMATHAYLAELDPTYVPFGIPDKCEVVFHEDGTVTVTDNRNED